MTEIKSKTQQIEEIKLKDIKTVGELIRYLKIHKTYTYDNPFDKFDM